MVGTGPCPPRPRCGGRCPVALAGARTRISERREDSPCPARSVPDARGRRAAGAVSDSTAHSAAYSPEPRLKIGGENEQQVRDPARRGRGADEGDAAADHYPLHQRCRQDRVDAVSADGSREPGAGPLQLTASVQTTRPVRVAITPARRRSAAAHRPQPAPGGLVPEAAIGDTPNVTVIPATAVRGTHCAASVGHRPQQRHEILRITHWTVQLREHCCRTRSPGRRALRRVRRPVGGRRPCCPRASRVLMWSGCSSLSAPGQGDGVRTYGGRQAVAGRRRDERHARRQTVRGLVLVGGPLVALPGRCAQGAQRMPALVADHTAHCRRRQ